LWWFCLSSATFQHCPRSFSDYWRWPGCFEHAGIAVAGGSAGAHHHHGTDLLEWRQAVPLMDLEEFVLIVAFILILIALAIAFFALKP
jgi:hypothetical protein